MFNTLRNYNYSLIVVIELLFITLLYRSYLFPPDTIGIIDHDFFLSWQLLINDALNKGQILHWAFHFCGGIPALANPQSGALSPYNILGLFVNPVIQMKMNVIIHFFICAVGFIFLCKRMKVSPYFGVVGFIIWTGNGFILFRILHGQQTFYPLLYLPILVGLIWPYIAVKKNNIINIKDVVSGVVIVSLIILEDGFQILIYFFTFLFFVSTYSIIKKNDFTVVYVIFLWLFFAIGLVFFRIFPVAELLSEFPRVVFEKDYMSMAMVIDAFFENNQLYLYQNFPKLPPHNIWAAYGAFLGWPPLVLCAIAIFKYRTVEIQAICFGALMCLLLMFGHFSEYAPWEILHSMPLLENVRAPHRFSSMVILALSIISIFTVHKLHSNLSFNRPIRIFITASILTAIVFSYLYSLSPILKTYTTKKENIEHVLRNENVYKQILLTSQDMYPFVANNKGIYNCYRALELPNHSTPIGSLVHANADVVPTISPNTIDLFVNAKKSETIVINQNYHRDWRVVLGKGITELKEVNGLLSVDVQPGKQTIKLKYMPYAFNDALKISLVWALMFLFFIYYFNKNK